MGSLFVSLRVALLKRNIQALFFFYAQSDHHGVKYFKCDQCNKPFTFLINLQYHMKSHDRRKLYTCPICQVSYISLPIIKGHVKDQHNNTCDTCKTVYSNIKCFIQHITRDANICRRRKKCNHKSIIGAYPCNECKTEFQKKSI